MTTSLPAAEFLFRHTSDAVVIVDEKHVAVAANPRAETLLQRESSAVVGKPIGDWLTDFSGSPAEAQLSQISSTALERRIEHFSASRYTWYEVRAVPNGRGLVLFVRDVSDRARQAKTEAVREAVRQIVMDAPVAISITRGPDHRYEIVNAMARKLIGDRELEGRTARSAFPDVDPALFSMLDEVYRTGKPVSVKDLPVSFDRGDGQQFTGSFDVTYQPVFEADGTVSGVLSTSVETTSYVAERRRLESMDASTSTGRA